MEKEDRHLVAPYSLRIPPDLKSWLMADAKANRRSLNGEVIYVLERYRAQKQEAHEKHPA